MSRKHASRFAASFFALLFVAVLGCNPVESPSRGSEPLDSSEIQESVELVGTKQLDAQLLAVATGQTPQIQTDAQVGSDFLRRLPELDGKLLDLRLDAGRVSDSELHWIGKVQSLEHLRLRESEISDQGITTLVASGEWRKLQILNFPQARVSASGIRELARLPRLKQLRLGGSTIDDEAAKAIATLPKLQSLHLIGPGFSDAALKHLALAPKLASFYLDDCPLSDEAWTYLFEAKPNLHVHIDQQHHDRDPHAHQH